MPFSKFSSPHVSPGAGTETVTPKLPGDTRREDAKETFKENKGYVLNLGRVDNGTLWIIGYPTLLCPKAIFKMELVRESVTS